MTRKQKRKIAIIVVLVLLLALLGAYYAYYKATHKLTFDIAPTSSDVIQAPQYLYSFAGGGKAKLQRPIGVLVDGRNVYVVDSGARAIHVFSEDGTLRRTFGTKETVVPLYIAKNPKTGILYVSDRRARSVMMFSPSGEFKGVFNPKLPKDQLPKFDTGGVQWAPVAIAFSPDGTMYVTEILNGHRLLIFGPDGKFKKSVGTVGTVIEAKSGPRIFQFPNGIAVHNGMVYIADSNNRRVQVFKADGTFDRIIVTQGLPRGIAFLARFRGDKANTADRFVVVDTLAHDGTVWSTKDAKIVSFGENGILDGQFLYPNGVSVMRSNNKIFISDTANGRVQVWGWPSEASPVPIPRVPQRWYLCLTPLLLLPLLLLRRRKRFMATVDFVESMEQLERLYLMPDRRRRWSVRPEDYEVLSTIEQDDVRLSDLLNADEYSDSETRAIMERFEVEADQASALALAKRAHIFCTNDMELRRMAKALEIEVVNSAEFVERFTPKRAKRNSDAGGAE